MPAWLIAGTRQQKKTVLRIRLGRDQGRSRCLTALSNRWNAGSDFAIGLISSPRWEQDTERKRRPSNDRVPGNKTERQTVSSTCWEQEPRALPSKRLKALPDQRSVPSPYNSARSFNHAFLIVHSRPNSRWHVEPVVWLSRGEERRNRLFAGRSSTNAKPGKPAERRQRHSNCQHHGSAQDGKDTDQTGEDQGDQPGGMKPASRTGCKARPGAPAKESLERDPESRPEMGSCCGNHRPESSRRRPVPRWIRSGGLAGRGCESGQSPPARVWRWLWTSALAAGEWELVAR